MVLSIVSHKVSKFPIFGVSGLPLKLRVQARTNRYGFTCSERVTGNLFSASGMRGHFTASQNPSHFPISLGDQSGPILAPLVLILFCRKSVISTHTMQPFLGDKLIAQYNFKPAKSCQKPQIEAFYCLIFLFSVCPVSTLSKKVQAAKTQANQCLC